MLRDFRKILHFGQFSDPSTNERWKILRNSVSQVSENRKRQETGSKGFFGKQKDRKRRRWKPNVEEVTKKHFLLLFFFFRETDGSLPFFSLIFSPVPAASGGPKARVVIDRVKGKKKSQKSFSFLGFPNFSFLFSLSFRGEKFAAGQVFPFPLPPSFGGPEGWWVQGRKLRFPVKNRRGEEKKEV